MKKRTRTAAITALLLFFALCLGACGAHGGDGETDSERPEAMEGVGFRQTVLYFLSEEGYIVPVMKSIPWEEGIGKAALSYLVDTPDNRAAADTMGLAPIIPEGTRYTLRISDEGVATLDLTGLTACADERAESAMVEAIVNTLTEFPAIDAVEITVNGARNATLPNGVRLNGAMSAFTLNAEDGEIGVSTEGASALTLYFPNATGSLNVPVTRYIAGAVTPETAVRELIDGPAGGALINCFPQGTKLLDAGITAGVATVNLSEEFFEAGYVEGLDEAAYETLYLTLAGIGEVSRLELLVGGELYEFAAETSAPVYSNTFR